jgi:hypothetical protein
MLKDTDRGWKKLLVTLQQQGVALTVGIHEDKGAEQHRGVGKKGATVADVASFNEFGTRRIPSRPFIRAWFDESLQANTARLRTLAKLVVAGKMTTTTMLNRLGLTFRAQAQGRIAAGVSPPNAPSTIQRKGSSKPLIDTGQLKASIDYKIEGL